MSVSRRHDQTFSLLMIDVDNFKYYNDHFGHPAGDKALQGIAQTLMNTARTHDYLVRYGGEEFAVILPKASRRAGSVAAERHRRAVEKTYFLHQSEMPGGNLTISVGCGQRARGRLPYLRPAQPGRPGPVRGQARPAGNTIRLSDPERRRHPRVDYRAQVDFRYLDAEQTSFQGETLDISLGGVRIAVTRPVDKGRPLEFLIHTPEGPGRHQAGRQRGSGSSGPSPPSPATPWAWPWPPRPTCHPSRTWWKNSSLRSTEGAYQF